MVSLVTGGAGFIGSHLCEALVERGDEVIILDDLSTGQRRNIEHLLNNGQARFYQGSILDAALVDDLVSRCDKVFHLAAVVGVKLVLERPLHVANVNILGSHNVIAAAAKYRKPMLLASTSEVYGEQEAERFSEDMASVLGPVNEMRWIYAVSKFNDEYTALAYAQEADLQVIIARFFNTTGPRQSSRYGMVVPRFVEAALKGEPLTVFGDGKQVRSFCHVKDVVRAVLMLADKPECYGEVFNIGADEPVTIRELAERVIATTGSNSEIVHIPYEKVYGRGLRDIRYRVPDISKLRRYTGYAPEYTLQDILEETTQYYRQRLGL